MTGLRFICRIFSKITSILRPSSVEEMALKLLGYQPKCTLYFHNILSATNFHFLHLIEEKLQPCPLPLSLPVVINTGTSSQALQKSSLVDCRYLNEYIPLKFLFLLRSSFFVETETVSVSFSGNGKIWHEDPIIVTMNNNWTENYCHFSTK